MVQQVNWRNLAPTCVDAAFFSATYPSAYLSSSAAIKRASVCVSDTAQLLLSSALLLMNKIQLMQDAGHFWFARISVSEKEVMFSRNAVSKPLLDLFLLSSSFIIGSYNPYI